MTNMTSAFRSMKRTSQAFPAGVVIVVAPPFAAALRAGEGASPLADAVVLELDPAAPLELSGLGNAPVAVVEVDPGSEPSVSRIMGLRLRYPDLPVIAALARADIATTRMLVRGGIRDVAQLPFDLDDLAAQVMDVAAEQASAPGRASACPLVAVIGATGGCGATSVLTHLAAAMAKANPGSRGVCLIDLDLQKGTAASFLGIEPQATIQALIEAGGRLDRDLMMSAVTDSGRGFSFIAAPDAIAPIDRLDVDHLLAIVTQARAEFDYVLIDLPPLWADWTLSLINWTDNVVLLTDTAISNLRQAKRTASLLSSVDVPAERVSLVINRMERKLFGSTKVAEIARALGRGDIVTIADAGPALRSAQDQGALLPAIQGKTKFGADIERLADHIIQGATRS
ncbi:AAA family ATPase [Altererythrobacter aerius]|uniref:AAA family ATPase n=1 Tax=Tsuneonella aeria TaxID=1837929 RepID=A0A6I4TF43_9SPHN|nr:P-loop NTPase [Tsuneonella aeria]MXO75237.1 AAA family ATPase [Tsuneonella aeria]